MENKQKNTCRICSEIYDTNIIRFELCTKNPKIIIKQEKEEWNIYLNPKYCPYCGRRLTFKVNKK